MDLYKVLGVKKTATPEEIKTAGRKKSNQHHPDRNPGNPKAAQKFKEVQEAVEVLLNEAKRRVYDTTGEFYVGAFAHGGVLTEILSKFFEKLIKDRTQTKTTDCKELLIKFISTIQKEYREEQKLTETAIEKITDMNSRMSSKEDLLKRALETLMSEQQKKLKGIAKFLSAIEECREVVETCSYDYIKQLSGVNAFTFDARPFIDSWNFGR